MNLHEDKEAFKNAIIATAQYINIPETYIEKDYWVTYILRNLSLSEFKDKAVFKGGTSLSKGYKLIDRFSEDVDLVLLKIGYREDGDNEKLMSSIHKTICKAPLKRLNGDARERDSISYKKKIYEFEKIDSNGEYYHGTPDITLEINCFNEPTPTTTVQLKSYIHDFFEANGYEKEIIAFQLEPFELQLLCTTRTFLEKILSLYRGAHQGILIKRIRHFYDIYMLLTHDVSAKALYMDKAELKKRLQYVIGEEKFHKTFCDVSEFLPLSESAFEVNYESFRVDLKVAYKDFESMLYKGKVHPTFDEVEACIKDIRQFIKENGL